MNKLLALLFFALLSFSGFSQTFREEWAEIKFEKPQDYKAHEADMLQGADYILHVPMKDFNRQAALNALAQWMSGTPDHNFIIGEKVAKLNNDNEFVMSIYMASMVKYVIEHAEEMNDEKVELGSFNSMLDYIANRDNKFRITKGIQKAIDARRKGKLDQYLKK